MPSIQKMPSDFGASRRQFWRRNDGNEFQNGLACISSISSRHALLKPLQQIYLVEPHSRRLAFPAQSIW